MLMISGLSVDVASFLRKPFFLLFISLLMVFPHVAFSQNSRNQEIIDSLRYIADTSHGRNRVFALRCLANELVEKGFPGSKDQYFSLLSEALDLSEEMGYKDEINNLRRIIGRELAEAGFFRESLPYARAVIDSTSGLNTTTDSNLMMGGYSVLSLAYRGLGKYDSALYFLNKALKIGEHIVSRNTLASTYLQLAGLYISMGDPLAALESHKEAYYIKKNSRDPQDRENIGAFSRVLGYSFMTNGNYKMALRYFREADSLYGNMQDKSLRVKVYHTQQAANIARVYQHWGKLDSALLFRQLALQRFSDYGIGETNINVPNQYCYIGTIYREQGDFRQAQEFFNRSLVLRKQIKDSLGVGMCLDEMAEMARLKGDHQQAVNMLQEALSWKTSFRVGEIDPFRHSQWLESRSETYLYLGKVFADWDKPADALLYYDTSLMLCRRINFLRGMSIAEFYRGLAWQQKGEQDTAMRYFQRSLELARRMDNRHLEARALAGIAGLKIILNEIPAALSYYETALAIYIENGFIREIPEIYLRLGQTFVKSGNRLRAVDMLNKAYEHSGALGMINIQSEAALLLAELYENAGNQSMAVYFLKEYILFHDSVFKIETHRQLSEMQALHESQQQQMTIRQLNQENELNIYRANRSEYVIISLGAIVIIILLFVVLFIRQVQLRNQQSAMLNQQQLFRVQMNPHFIFNSLTHIQHYIFARDPMKAGKYLAVFAKLMRNILEHSRCDQITLREEIETISRYLELQQLRFENKLVYELIVDESLDQDLTEIPPMLAQPFIENAIEHGIRNKEGRGSVFVRIFTRDHAIVFEIEDDGIGRKKAALLKEKKQHNHQSTAVILTQSRLQNLWGKKKPNDIFEIRDLYDLNGSPAGTLVRFLIPES